MKDGVDDAFISKTLNLGSLASFVEKVGGPALREYNFSQREIEVYTSNIISTLRSENLTTAMLLY